MTVLDALVLVASAGAALVLVVIAALAERPAWRPMEPQTRPSPEPPRPIPPLPDDWPSHYDAEFAVRALLRESGLTVRADDGPTPNPTSDAQ